MRHRPLLVIALLWGFPIALTASSTDRGAIHIRAFDKTNLPLANAMVILDGRLPSTTGASGTCLFPDVTPGPHDVEVTDPEGRTVVRSRIPVVARTVTTVDFHLDGEPDEIATILRETALLDPWSFGSATSFDETALRSIPGWKDPFSFLGRTAGITIAGAHPGGRGGALAQPTFSTRGAGPAEATWNLGSFPIDDVFEPGSTPFLTSAASLQAIRIATSPFDIESSSAGAEITLVPVTPPNALEGEIQIFLHDGTALAGSGGPSEVIEGNRIESAVEGSAGVGGPIVTDRLWGLLNILGHRERFQPLQRYDDTAPAIERGSYRTLLMSFDYAAGKKQSGDLLLVDQKVDHSTGDSSFRLAGLEHVWMAGPSIHIETGVWRTERRNLPDDRTQSGARFAATAFIDGALIHLLEAGARVRRHLSEELDASNESLEVWFGDRIIRGLWVIDAGARYERDQVRDGSQEHISTLLPRVGISRLIDGEHRAVVRASFARYSGNSGHWWSPHAEAEPDDRAEPTDEWLLEIEREILPEMTAGVTFAHRTFSPVVEVTADLQELDFWVRKRLSSAVYLQASASLADADDALPTNDPWRPATAQWALHLDALVQIPGGFDVALSLHGRDGLASPDGSELSNLFQADIRVARPVRIGPLDLRLGLDVLNLANQRIVTARDEQGAIQEMQPPRAVRIDASIRF